MRGNSILRPSLLRQAFNFRCISSSFSSRIPLNRSNLLSTSEKNHSIPETPFSISTLRNPNLSRTSSDSAPDVFEFTPSFAEPELAPVSVPDNVLYVKSEEEYNFAVTKTEEESASVVFYFTATWCAPCRLIGPVMDELARRTPDVTIYKIDIDETWVGSILESLNVTSVPTIHYYKEGKKEVEVVGGDATRIIHTMKDLYNTQNLKPEDSEEEVKEKIDAEDSQEEVRRTNIKCLTERKSNELLSLQEVEKVLNDVRADDVTVIPVGNQCDWGDFMVVATGRSTWHVKNIAQALIYKVKQKQRGAKRMVLPSVEGQETGKWIVIDSGRVIIHALDEKARAYYSLEKNWTEKTAHKEPVEELTKAFVKVRRINNSKKPAQRSD